MCNTFSREWYKYNSFTRLITILLLVNNKVSVYKMRGYSFIILSVLSAQLIQGAKDLLTTTFPSTTPSSFGVMDRFVEDEGKLF